MTAEHHPDYFQKISNPMDLFTIQRRNDCGYYTNIDLFVTDVRQITANTVAYFPYEDPSGLVHKSMVMEDTVISQVERIGSILLGQCSDASTKVICTLTQTPLGPTPLTPLGSPPGQAHQSLTPSLTHFSGKEKDKENNSDSKESPNQQKEKKEEEDSLCSSISGSSSRPVSFDEEEESRGSTPEINHQKGKNSKKTEKKSGSSGKKSENSEKSRYSPKNSKHPPSPKKSPKSVNSSPENIPMDENSDIPKNGITPNLDLNKVVCVLSTSPTTTPKTGPDDMDVEVEIETEIPPPEGTDEVRLERIFEELVAATVALKDSLNIERFHEIYQRIFQIVCQERENLDKSVLLEKIQQIVKNDLVNNKQNPVQRRRKSL